MVGVSVNGGVPTMGAGNAKARASARPAMAVDFGRVSMGAIIVKAAVASVRESARLMAVVSANGGVPMCVGNAKAGASARFAMAVVAAAFGRVSMGVRNVKVASAGESTMEVVSLNGRVGVVASPDRFKFGPVSTGKSFHIYKDSD